MTLKKREWVYLSPPSKFEVSGCSCGNLDCQWSEYETMLWCGKCEIDFVPIHNGVFDGPIPIELSKLMGLSFARLDLLTHDILDLDFDNNYIKLVTLEDVYSGKCSVVFKNIVDKNVSFKAVISITDGDFNISESDHKITNGQYYANIHFRDRKVCDFQLFIDIVDDVITVTQDDKSINFLKLYKTFSLDKELSKNIIKDKVSKV